MKICYICTDPGIPVNGRKGCSTHVRETCYALTRLGHEVKLLCANTEGDAQHEGLDIVEVAPYKSRKLGFDMRHILLDRRMWATLQQTIETWRPDAIYERYSLYSRAGTLASRRYGLPRLMEVNAFLTREQEQRIRMGWLARRVEASIIRQAPSVIVVSEPLRREIHELGVPFEHIVKMPMAVDLEKFNPNVSPAGVREQYGLEGRFVIGYVGTLAGWHGIRLLYDMANELKAAGAPPFAFFIVGGTQDKLDMHRAKARQAGLENELRFIGSVAHDEVPRHLQAMDVAIVPDTTYWSSPAKLFEYQASGLPVLAPSYPAIHEVLEHGREGYIFPPLDVKQMAALALELMNKPDVRREMAQNARRRAEAEHSWLNNGEEIMNLYRKLGAKG